MKIGDKVEWWSPLCGIECLVEEIDGDWVKVSVIRPLGELDVHAYLKHYGAGVKLRIHKSSLTIRDH